MTTEKVEVLKPCKKILWFTAEQLRLFTLLKDHTQLSNSELVRNALKEYATSLGIK